MDTAKNYNNQTAIGLALLSLQDSIPTGLVPAYNDMVSSFRGQVNAKRQSRYNMTLAGGVGFLVFTLFTARATDSFPMLTTPWDLIHSMDKK